MKYNLQATEAYRSIERFDDESPIFDWYINAWHSCGELEIPDEVNGKEFLQLLVDEGYLKPKAIELVYIDRLPTDRLILRVISKEDYQPLYELTEIQ